MAATTFEGLHLNEVAAKKLGGRGDCRITSGGVEGPLSHYRAPVKTALASAATLVAGALIVLGSMRLSERQRTANEINRLRDELYQARVAADRCRGTMRTSEASLRVLGITIDSLKSRVDSFETMNGTGVPAGRYTEYLGVFDSYNDSVEVWGVREQRLRTVEASCRSTIEGHNAISDSLQAVLGEAGLDAG